jgi:hypothetical protein
MSKFISKLVALTVAIALPVALVYFGGVNGACILGAAIVAIIFNAN